MNNTVDNEGYLKFRQALRDGTLQAGMTITQNELCDLLGVSLSPLRETLVLLEEFGLVEVKHRAGIRIIYPDVDFIRENFQFRIMIEVRAMRLFALQANSTWLAEMRARHEQVRADLASDVPVETIRPLLRQLDTGMHRDFVVALGNRAVLRTHERIQENLILARHVHERVFQRGHYLATLDEHARIFDSLEARDVEGAIASLEAHFQGSTHRNFAG